MDSDLVVGFASGVHSIHPDKAPELWIDEVVLAPRHRHCGLGKAVLQALLGVGRAHACTVGWVLTDRINPAATALCASLGGIEGADPSGPNDALLGDSFPLSNSTRE